MADYGIVVEHFAERHFIKSFKRKHRGAWEVTWTGIEEMFRRFDSLLETSAAETIIDSATQGDGMNRVRICKTEFRIVGTKESRHASGNRCIVALHDDTRVVHVLLVYGKTDLGNGNETAQWKQIVKTNYPEYRKLF